MARWSETRGYTLILTHARGPDRYARVALVQKRTLFGAAYNVREARAEDASRSGSEPEALGLGRMLSWRWLGEREAQELLAARLRTLEALGYTVLEQPDGEQRRGPWDWLRELVHRQLHRSSAEVPGDDEDRKGAPAEIDGAARALREAVERLGIAPDSMLEGIATILEIDLAALREPGDQTLRALEPELLTMLLPVWLEHDVEPMRDVGRRWLALAATPYEIDQAVLERWLAGAGPLAAALAPRFEGEALAWLGPEALGRLAHTAGDPKIKQIAGAWRDRLRAPVRAPG
jgi:hypothetical protein